MFQDQSVYANLLNLLILMPIGAALLVLLLPKAAARYVGISAGMAALVVGILLYGGFVSLSAPELATDGYIFETSVTWLSDRFDIKYLVGVDGISIYLLLLTAILAPITAIYAAHTVQKQQKTFYVLFLLLISGFFGVFSSLDLVLFFFFFELGLIPIFLMMGIWGGLDRVYAANKFFIYTLAGSVILLLGIIYLGFEAGAQVSKIFTSDLPLILSQVQLAPQTQGWLFLAFMAAFAIKIPIFPFHTWQATAYDQAPPVATILMAALMGKMGTYGLVRFVLPLFPTAAAEYAGWVCALAVVAILYGALVAMVQTNLKRLIAYSSLAHLGFVVLGIFAFTAEGLSGAVVQMFNHGITTAALFLLLAMLEERGQSMEIRSYQGIAKIMPTFTLLFIISSLASVGLPGLNGFVGEFLILMGSFGSSTIGIGFAVLAAAGVIFAAVYMLWMIRRVFFGALAGENTSLTDIAPHQTVLVLPLLLIMLVTGFHATPLLEEIGKSTEPLVQVLLQATSAVAVR